MEEVIGGGAWRAVKTKISSDYCLVVRSWELHGRFIARVLDLAKHVAIRFGGCPADSEEGHPGLIPDP